jgi:multidrug efflux system membrane fusion protein
MLKPRSYKKSAIKSTKKNAIWSLRSNVKHPIVVAIGVALTFSVSSFAFVGNFAMAQEKAQAQAKAQTIDASKVSKQLTTSVVRASNSDTSLRIDGVVEAVRQTQISAQISGAIVQLPVKAGDKVKFGQLLVSMDARAVQQNANASQAQVDAAKASLMIAEKDYERQKLLFEKNFISQAQLDRALSQFNASAAQAKSQIAQAAAVQTQSGFYSVRSPYNGIVSEMPSAIGDMAIPGRSMMTVYDPSEMRVIFNVPQASVAHIKEKQQLSIEFPSLATAQRVFIAKQWTVLPTFDAATHTVQIRVDLPKNLIGMAPGLFARSSLIVQSEKGITSEDVARLYVPKSSVFQRAQVQAVYVVNAEGFPIMRQVKAGHIVGEEQEILSGVSKGDVVVTNPLFAATLNFSKNSLNAKGQ